MAGTPPMGQPQPQQQGQQPQQGMPIPPEALMRLLAMLSQQQPGQTQQVAQGQPQQGQPQQQPQQAAGKPSKGGAETNLAQLLPFLQQLLQAQPGGQPQQGQPQQGQPMRPPQQGQPQQQNLGAMLQQMGIGLGGK